MKTRFNFPTRILFGQQTINDLPAELKTLNKNRPLVVSNSGLAATGILERVLGLLKKEGLEPLLFDQVSANPTDAQVEAGTGAYEQHQADSIVAVGGGSPMDAGKAIQIRINHKVAAIRRWVILTSEN